MYVTSTEVVLLRVWLRLLISSSIEMKEIFGNQLQLWESKFSTRSEMSKITEKLTLRKGERVRSSENFCWIESTTLVQRRKKARIFFPKKIHTNTYMHKSNIIHHHISFQLFSRNRSGVKKIIIWFFYYKRNVLRFYYFISQNRGHWYK